MKLDIKDYAYDLPPERIAKYPLAQRDQSKLLVYDKGKIHHESFKDIADFLPPETSLFFNETKVIPARLLFRKKTGAGIEIFLLHPLTPSSMLLEVMQSRRTCSWKCAIGNVKRWTSETSLNHEIHGVTMTASLLDRTAGIVQFTWDDGYTFAEMLAQTGNTPLPPYLKRDPEESDRERYQTVYSNHEGAVAAPTAGLHFTEGVFNALKQKNIKVNFLTLHVSAGTFQPIKVEDPMKHTMHQEQIVISRQNIEALLEWSHVVPVGTTSLRTLESLYWYGVKLIKNPEATFIISQQDPYTHSELPAPEVALHAVLKYMNEHQTDMITGETSIYIVPGYRFQLCRSLITNFHQPSSTLILLVAAFIGEDWKKIYQSALTNGYRFLSYGDSSLLIPRTSLGHD